MDIIILNFIFMAILFFIAYYAPKYNNIAFMVRLSYDLINTKEVTEIIYKFKTIALDLAIVTYIISSLFGIMIKSYYFYVSLGMSFYLATMLFLFYKYSKVLLKIRSSYLYCEEQPVVTQNKLEILKPYHYSLQVFLVLFMFASTFDYVKSLELFNIPFAFLTYPICSIISLIIFMVAHFKFKNKKIIYVSSLFIIFLFLIIQGIFLR